MGLVEQGGSITPSAPIKPGAEPAQPQQRRTPITTAFNNQARKRGKEETYV
mgnify:CR=1 FL=1